MTDAHLALGNMTGPVLVFGGPYSNLQATQAIKAVAERLEIPPERCICTGDIVAYCAQPKETVALIRDWGIHCLMGNCEESFANNAEDCGCGFEEGTHCDLLSAQWFQFANQALTSDQRHWFASLPRQITFTLEQTKARVIHGSVSSINQFIFASTEEAIFQQEVTLSEADLIIGGHSGIPFTKHIDKTVWHNTGALGMPANDGTPRTWFSIIDSDEGELRIRTEALDYDYLQAYQAMVNAGMDNGYAQGLTSGLWPSMDVLPEREQEKQGTALNFT
jgi:predicted phosphodiesterase